MPQIKHRPLAKILHDMKMESLASKPDPHRSDELLIEAYEILTINIDEARDLVIAFRKIKESQ